MGIFRPNQNDKKLIELIKKSSTDFNFGQKNLRASMMSKIEDQQMGLAEQKVRSMSGSSIISRHRWVTSLAVVSLIVIVSGSAVSQANISRPGDKLHSLDQFQEKIMLMIPLPATQKANIQARIVQERNQELDKLISQELDQDNVQALAAQESQKSLNVAIEQVLKSQERSESKGNTQQTEKLQQVLNKLNSLAAEQESKIEVLRERSNNDKLKLELNTQLEEIKKARLRAGFQQKP